jgi:hypothetical protein
MQCWVSVETGECVFSDTFEGALSEIYKHGANRDLVFTPQNLLPEAEYDRLMDSACIYQIYPEDKQ